MATLKTKFQDRGSKVQGTLAAPGGRRHMGRDGSVGFGAWCLSGVWSLVFGVFLAVTPAPSCFAQSSSSAESPSRRVHRLYAESKESWQRNPTNTGAATTFARACFDWADFATTDAKRAAIAEEGIAACRRAIKLEPKSAPAHLYLGMNLGQVARTKLLSALGILDEMEAVWKKAIELDPKFDHAGAHRSLGLLYLDAPGWPTSIGNKKKARQHLEKAVELHPEYPGNRLCLLEAQLKWGETKAVRAQVSAVEAVLQAARANLAGEKWALDWREWDERWQRIKSRVGVVSARSPRDNR